MAQENKNHIEEMQIHVSWRVRDAWNAIPPCSYSEPFCHVDCPYFYECNPPEDDYNEDEQWP